MKIAELTQKLNSNNIDNVYLVTGNEQVFIKQIKELFRNLMSPEEQDMNFSSFDLEESSLEDMINEAISAPFFGERRLVFVDRPYFMSSQKTKNAVEQNPDLLIRYIQNPTPSTILVIFATYDKLDARKKVVKQLKKLATNVDASQMDSYLLVRTVKADLKRSGYEINQDALELLINKTKSNYSQIINQMDKLKIYALKSKKIDIKAVNELVPQSLDDDIFDLMNQILNKNIYQAEELYSQFLLQKIDPILLVAIIMSQLRILIQTKVLSSRGLTEGTIAKNLKVNPYRVKMTLKQGQNIQLGQLTEMFDAIVNLDYQIKSGQGDKELLFDLFIAKYA
ncbi:DNA polymerase III subunit delta [Companilactobacillus allii]|uniref:DNA polymerase III subunit delta n=1 Tax=Companilactobacillus allii TaxID=1847728 RepID=A0A1P8Q589_9LACO|nr:DNA polymerase III subunit delta [Companilactobacillus allii]APX73016.1 DNA polymerase III subunit delta [Companilactobacillus allii]USQ67813.1 DNA polymerase III subunit delta [Companilactobacillus allii]